MVKKRRVTQPKKQTESQVVIGDQLSEELKEQLLQAKKQLVQQERIEKEEQKSKRLKEIEEREKNKSFGELLDDYWDAGARKKE